MRAGASVLRLATLADAGRIQVEQAEDEVARLRRQRRQTGSRVGCKRCWARRRWRCWIGLIACSSKTSSTCVRVLSRCLRPEGNYSRYRVDRERPRMTWIDCASTLRDSGWTGSEFGREANSAARSLSPRITQCGLSDCATSASPCQLSDMPEQSDLDRNMKPPDDFNLQPLPRAREQSLLRFDKLGYQPSCDARAGRKHPDSKSLRRYRTIRLGLTMPILVGSVYPIRI